MRAFGKAKGSMSSFEKSVKGATKVKLAAPKSKYVEHILIATHSGEAGVAEVFRSLTLRLRDSTWTIVFKSLIIVHLMLREGERDVTVGYLAKHPKALVIQNYTDTQMQGRNIRHYESYLLERCRGYRDCKVDFARDGEGRLKRLGIDKGLLRETESVQGQIEKLVKCDVMSDEVENEVTTMAFRMITMDLLKLFNVVNEAIINILEHYFELSKNDAERALNIYKAFATQTGRVIKFLTIARQYEVSTRLQVPRLKHAPLSLAKSLEDYLNDPDFEINRRQFLAQQEARRTGKKPSTNAVSSTSTQKKTTSASPDQGPAVPAKPSASVGRGPAPDLIDFFASIESNQESMFGNPTPTQTTQPGEYQPGMQLPPMMTGQGQGYTQLGMPGQVFPHDPMIAHVQNQSMGQQDPLLAAQFLPMNTGVYGDQPMQQPQQMFGPNPGQTLTQDGMANSQPQSTGMMQSQQLQQQTTNPFRQSMMPTGGQQSTDPSSRQSTNPFAKSPKTSMPGLPEGSMAAFAPQTISPSFVAQPHLQFPQPPGISPPAMQYPTQQQQPQQQQPQQQQPQQQYAPALQSMPTGTNPFARSQMGAGPSQPMISPPVSGGLVPQPTGSTNPFRQSMLPSNQATMGGMQTEQMSTIPVFPRPGQMAPQQQQQY